MSDNAVAPADAAAEDLEHIDQAVEKLATIDARLAELADLKFFAGLTLAEIAALRGGSERTANHALLTNFKSSAYWSQSEFAPMAHVAWATALNGFGSHAIIDKSSGTYAVAVRNGDVAAAVPEPGTVALVLLALATAAVARRRPLEPMCRS